MRDDDGNTIDWYALAPAQIAQLQDIAENGTGRAAVMARSALCFFFGICLDDDNQPVADLRRAGAKDGEGYMPILIEDSLSFSITFGPIYVKEHDPLLTGTQSSFFVSCVSDTAVFNNREYRTFSVIPDGEFHDAGHKMYLREDTTTGQLFRYYPEYDAEVITCDLSLQPGDTFCLPTGNYPCWIVDSVTYEEGRKIVWFPPVELCTMSPEYYNFRTCFIEGVGPTFGPFGLVDHHVVSNILGLLLCVHHNDSLIYMADTVMGCEQYAASIPGYPNVSMKLYPNPTGDILHVEFEGIDDPQGLLTITDLAGVVVLTRECHDPVIRLNVSHLAPGLYVVGFRNEKGVVVRKFVKM